MKFTDKHKILFYCFILLILAGCNSLPRTHFPPQMLRLTNLANYKIAYCWQLPEGRKSITLPGDQEVAVVVSRADGEKKTVIRDQKNLPPNIPSDFYIYKSGCIDEGSAIRYAGNDISWRPGADEITFIEGSDAFLTDINSKKLTPNFVLQEGDLSILKHKYLNYFGVPRGLYWSSDGMKLATLGQDASIFNSVGDNIWVYNFQTDSYSRITNITDAGDFIANASWSKDGKMLAIEYQKNSGIRIVEFGKTTNDFSCVDVTSATNPELSDTWPFTYRSIAQLFLQKNDVAFNRYVSKASLPVWLDKQNKIIFAASSKSKEGRLYIVNTDGCNLLPLFPDIKGLLFMPALSPDEENLAFVRYSSWKDRTRAEIIMANLETKKYISLVVLSAPGNGEELLISGMSWSPDGKYIVFSSNQKGESDIYIITSDGQSWLNLTEDTLGNAVSPVWQP